MRLSRHCEGVKRFSAGVLLAGGAIGAGLDFFEHTSDGEADPQPASTTHQIKRQHMNGEMVDNDGQWFVGGGIGLLEIPIGWGSLGVNRNSNGHVSSLPRGCFQRTAVLMRVMEDVSLFVFL